MWQMLIARSCHKSQANVNPYTQMKPLRFLLLLLFQLDGQPKVLEGGHERAPRPGIIIFPKASTSAYGMS